KDALLFFRLGDFYEAFCKDAEIIAKEVNLTLTARQGTPMCGVPFHTAETYIDRLLAKGYRVAVAEQVEDPKNTKGLVRREVVRIVTPGTTLSSTLVSEKKNNFFASVVKVGDLLGFSFLDVTTGEFFAAEFEEIAQLEDALHRIRPAEILVEKGFLTSYPQFLKKLSFSFPFLLNEKEECNPKIAHDALVFHLDTSQIRGRKGAVGAAGILLLYLKEDLSLTLEQVRSIDLQPFSLKMGLDHATFQHLELAGSLLTFLDQTATPMGGRLLSSWLKSPLLNCEEIRTRQSAIAEFHLQWEAAKALEETLCQIKDLERLTMKVLTQIAGPRDLYALGLSLRALPTLKKELEHSLVFETASIFDATALSQKILSALTSSPPLRIGEGEIFQDGFDPELDQLRQIAKDSMSWIARYQTSLREETGIKTLKVGYTKAFGYYIEVSRGQSEKAPSSFQRRQTLVNGERFVTEELKAFEHQVLTAEERAKALESEHFVKLRLFVATFAASINQSAKAIARIDALLSLARIAKYEEWCCPIVDDSDILDIRGGRHPIVEKAIGKSSFIANETQLNSSRQMMLITGPNMAGKSTYIRQVALIAILAQIGSYVPATSARIGVIDQVFSRIGASDDLVKGQSTFMVEMTETANILRHATSRSLVILDEIGRGTSTYDGISIAWAVAEYLLTQTGKQAKTLFATHYWELTQLEERFPHLINYQTAIRETDSGILFLRKMVPGGTDKSYGIHVAKLAGLPPKAIRKAEEILILLEKGILRRKEPEQLSLFPMEEEETFSLVAELRNLDIHQLTPVQAWEKLAYFQRMSNAV
ncbi:MAG TPA: DNA mismatch repair protein MutS, partial [Chlamydiales bacterium]|nr:DNA mismatch repair protein MutS [Chlamydiales bacterium]